MIKNINKKDDNDSKEDSESWLNEGIESERANYIN